MLLEKQIILSSYDKNRVNMCVHVAYRLNIIINIPELHSLNEH